MTQLETRLPRFGAEVFVLVLSICSTLLYGENHLSRCERCGIAAQNAPLEFPPPVLSAHELTELFGRPVYQALRRPLDQLANEESLLRSEQKARGAELGHLIAIWASAAEYLDAKQRDLEGQHAAVRLAHAAHVKNSAADHEVFVELGFTRNSHPLAAESQHVLRSLFPAARFAP